MLKLPQDPWSRVLSFSSLCSVSDAFVVSKHFHHCCWSCALHHSLFLKFNSQVTSTRAQLCTSSWLCRTQWLHYQWVFLFWIYKIMWNWYCSSAAHCYHIAKRIYMPQCVMVPAWGYLGMLKDLQTVGIMLRQEKNLVHSCPYCLRRVTGVC